MSPGQSSYRSPHPRGQSQRIADLLARERSGFRGVVIGKRREGKSDLLRQVFTLLFETAEGPIPIWYAFEATRSGDSLARHFAASLCQQARAFLMRQQELLGEPLAELERELERPGLPLSLTELGRDLIALNPDHRLDFSAALAAQFAHREGRPVCLLLDDAEAIGESSPFISALEAPQLSWLLTGRAPFASHVAGHRSWPVVQLDPLPERHAVSLARVKCEDAGLPFVAEAWELWLELAGTSPGLMQMLVDSAAITGLPLSTIDEVARVYATALSSGSLGNWLARRWEAAVPDRTQRIDLARQLAMLIGAHLPSSAVSSAAPALEGLLAEEWLTESGVAPILNLGMAESDWLGLASGTGTAQQREARLVQALLLRAEQHRLRRDTMTLLREIRETLQTSAVTSSPVVAGAHDPSANRLLPRICAVSTEQTETAELFWCYGFRGPRERAESTCVVLVSLCLKEPPPTEVRAWESKLQRESERLPRPIVHEEGLPPEAPHAAELWLVLPPDAPLQNTAHERRFHWSDFLEMLEGGRHGDHGDDGGKAPLLVQAATEQEYLRVTELEARAQWLEEELATAHNILRKAAPTPSGKRIPQDLPGVGDLTPQTGASTSDTGDPAWRAAMSMGLLLVSADLLALTAGSSPEMLKTVRSLQAQSRKLLDALKRGTGENPVK